MVGGVIAWRWKREPAKRPLLLCLGGFFVAAVVAGIVVPTQWVPTSRPGHPSWLNVATLGLLVGSFALAFWKEPSRRRLYALIIGPFVVLLFVANIVYPLVWQR